MILTRLFRRSPRIVHFGVGAMSAWKPIIGWNFREYPIEVIDEQVFRLLPPDYAGIVGVDVEAIAVQDWGYESMAVDRVQKVRPRAIVAQYVGRGSWLALDANMTWIRFGGSDYAADVANIIVDAKAHFPRRPIALTVDWRNLETGAREEDSFIISQVQWCLTQRPASVGVFADPIVLLNEYRAGANPNGNAIIDAERGATAVEAYLTAEAERVRGVVEKAVRG